MLAVGIELLRCSSLLRLRTTDGCTLSTDRGTFSSEW
jgi:hypothetical protein